MNDLQQIPTISPVLHDRASHLLALADTYRSATAALAALVPPRDLGVMSELTRAVVKARHDLLAAAEDGVQLEIANEGEAQ